MHDCRMSKFQRTLSIVFTVAYNGETNGREEYNATT